MENESIRHLKKILSTIGKLHSIYPKKLFTIDGRLLGDIGEVLAEQFYTITLNEGLSKHHDAIDDSGKHVQIKTTMKKSLTFPADHIPDYYIGIKLFPDGHFDEIYNGKGKHIAEYLKNHKHPKNNLFNISINILQQLSEKNKEVDIIKRR
jgi:hypothetical protein